MEFFFDFREEDLVLLDGGKSVRVFSSQVLDEELLELTKFLGLNLVEESLNTGEEGGNLLFSGHGDVLLLLEELSELLTSVKELLGSGIEIRTELGESSNLSVLSELELERTGNLSHGLDLSGRSNSRNGKTNIDGRSDTLVEELGLEEDLSISDGDNIGGDISRNISSLSLDNGESGEGSTAERLVHLSGSLQKSGVKVENISGVSLSARRSSKKKRHLSVSDGLLGEIVEDDKGVHTVISEVLANSASGIRSEELKRSSLGSSSGNDDGVVHGTGVGENLNDVRNSRSLLTDGNVDAVESLGNIASLFEVVLLVEDGIDGDSSLSSLSISDDKLSLSSADWNKGINSLESSLHRLVNRSSWHDTRSLDLNSSLLVVVDGTLSVNGGTKSIENSAEHLLTDGNIDNGSSSLDNITFLDSSIVVSKNNNTHIIGFEVKSHTLDSRGELNHLSGLDLVETEDSGDTISDRDDISELDEVVLCNEECYLQPE